MTSPQKATLTPPTFDLKSYLLDRQSQVEAALDAALPLAYPEHIYASMRYSWRVASACGQF
jgi:hypothetical protein